MRASGREYFVALLEKHGNNVTSMAAEAGLNRSGIYEAFKRHGVNVDRRKTHNVSDAFNAWMRS
jgi:transcriptional regulator of acetoin/glycerol metabolism